MTSSQSKRKGKRYSVHKNHVPVFYEMRRFGQGESYNPLRLVSQGETLKERCYKVVEGQSTRPVVLSMINVLYSGRRRRLIVFLAQQDTFVVPCPSLACWLDHGKDQ